MKCVLISTQPKWCELIASGKKTDEVRKTKPKLEPPFKVYIYQTKHREHNGPTYSDGKVIGEFVCDEIYETRWVVDFEYGNQYWDVRYKSEDDCLSDEEIAQYIGYRSVYYGWHISDLVIYEKPKGLSEFRHCGVNYHFNPPITRPPQSWCYVEGGE